MGSRLPALFLLLSVTGLPGCCSIAQGLSALFCGTRPDPWLERSYRTPGAALETFLGAISRDDTATIYRCLGPDFKRAWGIGEPEFELVWEKIKAEVPGIHIADQAQRGPAARRPGRRITYVLRLPFTGIEVVLQEYDYWRVISQPEGESEPVEDSRYVPRLAAHVQVLPAADQTPLRVDVPGPPIPNMTLAEIKEITAGREWKLRGLRVLED